MVIKTMLIKQQNVKCKESYDEYFEELANKRKFGRNVIVEQTVKSDESYDTYFEELDNKIKMASVVVTDQKVEPYVDPLQFVPNVIDRDTTIDNITLKAQLIAVYYYADSGYSDTEYDNNTNKTTDYADYDCTY